MEKEPNLLGLIKPQKRKVRTDLPDRISPLLYRARSPGSPYLFQTSFEASVSAPITTNFPAR